MILYKNELLKTSYCNNNHDVLKGDVKITIIVRPIFYFISSTSYHCSYSFWHTCNGTIYLIDSDRLSNAFKTTSENIQTSLMCYLAGIFSIRPCTILCQRFNSHGNTIFLDCLKLSVHAYVLKITRQKATCTYSCYIELFKSDVGVGETCHVV